MRMILTFFLEGVVVGALIFEQKMLNQHELSDVVPDEVHNLHIHHF